MNTSLFKQWLTDCLIPHVCYKRNATGYNGKFVLILDNASCHKDNDKKEFGIESLLEDNNIVIHYLVADSTSYIQPLDVGLFSLFKQELNKEWNKISEVLSCLDDDYWKESSSSSFGNVQQQLNNPIGLTNDSSIQINSSSFDNVQQQLNHSSKILSFHSFSFNKKRNENNNLNFINSNNVNFKQKNFDNQFQDEKNVIQISKTKFDLEEEEEYQKTKKEIKLSQKLKNVLLSSGYSKMFENPFNGLDETSRSVQLFRRIKDIKRCFDRCANKCDIIDAFGQCGIFVEKYESEYRLLCRPTLVRELMDRLDVLNVLADFKVRKFGSSIV